MSLSTELIADSLELAANHIEDLTEPVYERYFDASPESVDLMSHMDTLMRGRMLGDVLTLLMMSESETPVALKFEVKTHQANGVYPEMFNHLFDSLFTVVRRAGGDEWRAEFDEAWRLRIEYLNEQIRDYFGN